MKKTYLAPAIECMPMQTAELICVSGVEGDIGNDFGGIDFGGIDGDGVLPPASRQSFDMLP